MKKIVGILIIILLSICLLKPKEKVKLDNVILKQEINNKTFAMYKEDTENKYVPINDNKFPDMYVLNIEKSKCIDNNGQEITDALSYENDKVVLKSNRSIYCYLYFDKSLGEEIKEKNPSGLKTDKVRGEMYRFQGQQIEDIRNYICFGTSDKDICTANPDKYMYRIIGIEAETGRVKVIKMEALDQSVQWYTDYDHDIKFPDSKIYETISGDGFLENLEYVPNSWKEKIANNTWMYGDMPSGDSLGASQIGEELYKTETGKKETQWSNYATEETLGAIKATVGYEGSPYKDRIVYYTKGNGNWTEKFDGKVSLMYLHDYHYSVNDYANCQYDEKNYTICQTGWMHLSQNDQSVPNANEWVMSRLGWSPWCGYFAGHGVYSDGYNGTHRLESSISVRPVFYINASEKLLTGTEAGTIEDPFIIKS